MKIGYIISHASGLAHDDQHFLVLRFDAKAGFKPGGGESWIVRFVGGRVHNLFGGLAWYTGLWSSPSGKVYVSSADSQVLVNSDPRLRGAPWQTHDLRGTLTGIWGLDDQFVLTWGLRGKGTVVYRYDGATWGEIPSPGEAFSMRGLSPRMVYAVGAKGSIARWDGAAWHKVDSPTRATLSDVFIASDEEMYAVGDGVVLQGSTHGWAQVASGEGHMFGVAKWKGKVWIGGADDGLFQLKRDKLVPVDPELKAERFDARDELLVASPGALAFSTDGKDFKKMSAAALEPMFKAQKPQWLK